MTDVVATIAVCDAEDAKAPDSRLPATKDGSATVRAMLAIAKPCDRVYLLDTAISSGAAIAVVARSAELERAEAIVERRAVEPWAGIAKPVATDAQPAPVDAAPADAPAEAPPP